MRSESPRNKSVSPRTRRLRVAGALGAVLAAALVAGCGQDSGDETSSATSEAAKVMPNQSASPSGSPTSTAQLTEDQAKRKKMLSAVKITFSKAATTAVGEVSGGKLTELELEGVDDDHSSASPSADMSGSPSPSGSGSPSPSGSSAGPKWMAEVVEDNGTAHVVTIDAVSGDVLDSSPAADQSESDKQKMADRIAKAKQTPQQAAKVATDKKKGTVTSIDLDENDSKALVWKVDVVTEDWKKTTFDVDAENGKITNEEVDND
ncbi:PepSY domain-containing protein [Streptomyces sp. NBC_01754]|uniref:PepSY domain-containing protein n=1 Tax=Streptomyces sp. NBC_01754 TaxID=2975930 RepID=UPI002DDA3EE5|nr:PepSY domain-containing protein [Streptomyces sp. NBC_01754]WSC90996.1 PepSY domain-containing protein [Streptomyces sp. NBC_01754]